jgi:ATP-dependent helicase/nuclease subunit A
VWAGAKDADVAIMAQARQQALAAAENEYRRLLYVAMTRAADRLIVCGIEGRTKRPDRCWYDLVVDTLTSHTACSEELADDGDGNVWRFRPVPTEHATPTTAPSSEPYSAELPDWLRRAAPIDARQATSLSPSLAVTGAPSVKRGLSDADNRARQRGMLIHQLMRSLPDIAPDRRGEAAQRMLTRQIDFSPAEADVLLGEVLAVLDDLRFAPLFMPGSRAEVPITGRIARPAASPLRVVGQVDRLAVTADSVLIVDFKTNRPAPRRIEEVPAAYSAQLALYRAVLAKLYPGRVLRAALLWTDVPDLMELSAQTLDSVLAQVLSQSCGP